jgi:coenzyme F420-reducing hydrogenase beta subunit
MAKELIQFAMHEFEKKENNIEKIYENRLCSFCGACILVCPVDAIEYDDAQIVVNDSCTKCGKCLDICAQNQKERYKTKIFEKESNKKIKQYLSKFKSIPFGFFINLYNCKATRKEILDHAMIGGTTLAILSCALNEKEIDKIVATEFIEDKQFPTAVATNSYEQLLKSGGSKYLPTMSLDILKEISQDDKINSCIITTLPCQAYVLEKLKNQKESEELVKKIKYVITLLCGSGLPTREDVENFLRKEKIEVKLEDLNIHRERRKKFWRINPQHEERYIYNSEDGKEYDFSSKMILRTRSITNCSSVCQDYTGIHSDISIGGSSIGRNIVVTRTEKGEELVRKAISKGYLKDFKRFNFLEKNIIKFMGNNKRKTNRDYYEKLFCN